MAAQAQAAVEITAERMRRSADGALLAEGAVHAVRTPALVADGAAMQDAHTVLARFRETITGKRRAFRFVLAATPEGLRIARVREVPPPATLPAPAPSSAVQKLLDRWRRAWNRHDAAAMQALLASPAAAPLARWQAAWARAPREELFADRLRYAPREGIVRAEGQVRLRAPQGEGRAARLMLWLRRPRMEAEDAAWRLPDGKRLRARRLIRKGEHLFLAEEIVFTRCPPEAESWRLRAGHGRLDLANGWFTAKDAQLELGPVPLFWAPWWRQAVRRHSGLLAPEFGSDRQRGSVITLPLYLAPRADWDATLTPTWMSRRGLLAGLELRHAARWGRFRLYGEGLRDRQRGRNRNRWALEAEARLGPSMRFTAQGEGVSDAAYLADLVPGRAQTPYLVREASLSGALPDGDWRLRAQMLQNLARPDLQPATLAVLPELSVRAAPEIAPGVSLELAPTITRFVRRTGLRGTRAHMRAALAWRHEWLPGGLAAGARLGIAAIHWRLRETAPVRASLAAPFASLWLKAAWERFFGDLRHEVALSLRGDFVQAREQTRLPLLDAGLVPYGWSSLATPNRFTGGDRLERARRLSLVLTQRWQRHEADGVRELVRLRLGAGYRLRQPITDRRLEPFFFASGWEPLLAALTWHPLAWLAAEGEGEWDLRARRLVRATGTLALTGKKAGITMRYWETRPRFGAAARHLSAHAHWTGMRWHLAAGGDYDALGRRWLRAETEVRYRHPCWELALTGFAERGFGAAPGNRGVRLLLTLAGLGSLGTR